MNKLHERLLFTTSNEYVSPKKFDFHADQKKICLNKYIHVDETHLYLQFKYRATLLQK